MALTVTGQSLKCLQRLS